MAVVDENRIGQISPEMEEFRSMLAQVMERNLDRYRQHFQFGWTGSPDLANSVIIFVNTVGSR
jgi:thioredoxin domain-containing protein 10